MSSLLTAEGLGGLLFLFMVAVTLIGALIATNSVRLPRAISGLALCLLGVAGLYYYLNSPFLATMELLIYVGAVCVTIVFAIMLADPCDENRPGRQSAIGAALSFGVAGLLAWGMIQLAITTMWPPAAAPVGTGSMRAIGQSLLTTYSMVFELISVVLLMAIIGALTLARTGREK